MRWFRHLFAPSAKRAFPSNSLQRIAATIAQSEAAHTGEICFAVEPALELQALWSGQEAHERARDVFARLRIWDTQANNGVLLYLLLADHRIEIVADRGFDGKVSSGQWRSVCERVEQGMRAGDRESAVIAGIMALSELIAPHFPRGNDHVARNELPDLPRML